MPVLLHYTITILHSKTPLLTIRQNVPPSSRENVTEFAYFCVATVNVNLELPAYYFSLDCVVRINIDLELPTYYFPLNCVIAALEFSSYM